MKVYKNMTNVEIADLLRAVSASYEIKERDKNRFRIIAYDRAADAVEHLSSEAKDLWDDEKLTEVSGIGPSIAKHLGEIFKSGRSKHFEKVMSGISPAVFELMKLSGIGPARAEDLVEKLSISNSDPFGSLEKAIEKGEVSKLEGFGEDSEEAIKTALKEYKGRESDRMFLSYAMGRASEIEEWMKKSKVVEKVDTLGSLRRKASSVGDIDLAVSTSDPEEAIDHFVNFPKKTRVIEQGDKTASIVAPGNIQIDLMVANPSEYGSTLQHFTGSKQHNIALRSFAQKKKMSLSEYGIKKSGKIKKFETEQKFYKYLGMDYIPPELREDMGEIDAAREGKLPNLVELGEVKGDLQIHTDFDIETSHDLGRSSMKDIAQRAKKMGYEYVAFTDHNPSHSRHSKKRIVEILKRRSEKMSELNEESVRQSLITPRVKKIEEINDSRVIKVFNSLEVDILPDGSLPVPEEGMELLDFALVSIHSSFRQSRSKMTKRVVSALNQPNVKIFAHPTGRKINEREGVDLDWDEVFEVCVKRDIWIEVNASPSRLDLPDYLVREGLKKGIKLTLGTDSHHIDEMGNMRYGVYVARRGWAEAEDVVNTRELAEFEKLLGSV